MTITKLRPLSDVSVLPIIFLERYFMNKCTRDEAFERLLNNTTVADTNIGVLNDELNWWLDWANRRCDQVNLKLLDALKKIVLSTDDDAKYIAQQALIHNGYRVPTGD